MTLSTGISEAGVPRVPYHFSFSAPCGVTTAYRAPLTFWPAILLCDQYHTRILENLLADSTLGSLGTP
jgi:hypothetical protein